MIKRLTSIAIIVTFIVLTVWFTPTPTFWGPVSFGQVVTDHTTVYPYQASADRVTFVEQVGLPNKQALIVAATVVR